MLFRSDLTPQEFSLLYVLAQASGLPLSRLELLQRAWPDEIDNPRTVDTHILSLRKKLEVDPRQPNLIQTVRNVGYRFNPEVMYQPRTAELEHPEPNRSLETSAVALGSMGNRSNGATVTLQPRSGSLSITR